MNHHNFLERFAERGLRARQTVENIVKKYGDRQDACPTGISRRPRIEIPVGDVTSNVPRKTTRVGAPPVAASPGIQGAEGDKLSEPIASPRPWVIGRRKPYQIANLPAVRMLKRRSRQSAEITIQQIRWSDDPVFLRGILADPDRGPAYRGAAAQRLRKLGARRPKL